jgi:hypothetical protein
MTSTTTCSYTLPRITQAGSPFVTTPSGGNQSFQWASSSCITVSDDPVTEVNITGVEGLTVGIGFVVFLFSFFLFHAIMKTKTYD